MFVFMKDHSAEDAPPACAPILGQVNAFLPPLPCDSPFVAPLFHATAGNGAPTRVTPRNAPPRHLAPANTNNEVEFQKQGPLGMKSDENMPISSK